MSHFERADRLDGLAVSDIVQIKQRAADLARDGRSIIDLSIGEPDFDTPLHILAAAQLAMAEGQTHYTSPAGTAELRAAIVRKMQRENGLTTHFSSVFVGNGAKQVIANAFLATLRAGDEVVIPAPYWTNYLDMARFAGAVPVTIPCLASAGFLMAPEQLSRAITPRTRWLVLNSPSNPTGAAYDRTELAEIAAVLADAPHVMILEDAIYEHIMYDGATYHSLLNVASSLADRTLWVNGVSKAYAMTGWRIGYGAGPKPLIDAMTVVSAQTTSHPCSIAQAAAIAALDGDQSPTHAFREAFARRRAIICGALGRIAGLKIVEPRGAFYVFADAGELLGMLSRRGCEIHDDRRLVAHLLDRTGVALVPGDSFGAPGHFRLSFAASEADLLEAGARLGAAIRELTSELAVAS